MNSPRDLLVTVCLQQQNLQDIFLIASYFCWDFFFLIFSAYLALKAGVGAQSSHFHCVTRCNLGPELGAEALSRQCPEQPGFHTHLGIGSVESNLKTTGNSEKNLQLHHTTLEIICNEIFSILIPGEF